MKTLEELINEAEPFYPLLTQWIAKATNRVEVLPCNPDAGACALVNTQVTTHSSLGAVVYQTGGILIDGGWIRILGAGSERLQRSVPEWNKGKTMDEYEDVPLYLLIADDAIGGFYAINGGYLGKDKGDIYYYSPDMNEWMSMGISYPDFLLFCFNFNLDEFYEGLRWNSWKEDIVALKPDYAYSFYPFLWSGEAQDINKISRKVLPIAEIYDFNLGIRKS